MEEIYRNTDSAASKEFEKLLNSQLSKIQIEEGKIIDGKINKITDMSDLNSKDQLLLMKEIIYVSKIMKKLFKTSKLNVEKIGNMVPQLHIHIIARSKKDSSWPLSVWVVKGKIYTKTALSVMMQKVRKAFK